ncbi:T9SS type A sorting domain-containing protein [Ferruginibacter lapsinanis]|uniref:T9SS type A sorting domain-containing protein n=1 Tax=Ferruginibacter lapsinanis TaxID=563172 RepID=UPI001E3DD9D5|nr:T9SS type A sorting domain-containing protein [Ferruginibacter lapsinanis]UEG49499.1 T9SS type A sorting domain-containing protein [Ferruginibacter lapsinanis]
MKQFFTLSFLSLMLGLFSTTNANAQANNPYFSEGFDGGTISAVNPTTAGAPNKYWGDGKNNSGSWYMVNVYRTTGTSCANATYNSVSSPNSTMHIRILNYSGLADTPYIALPIVNFGVGSMSIVRSATTTTRTFRIYANSVDTSATTNPTSTAGGNPWVLVTTVKGSTALCIDTTININVATAKRIALVSGQAANGDYDSITLRSFSTITPVKFGSINAINSNGLTKVTWTSETELNTQNYLIERSIDGINFTQVGSLNATGANKYTWMDNAPLSSTAFYRVKGMDKTGSANYSSIVKLGANLKTQELVVAPNPVKGGQLNLQMNNFSKGQYTLSIYNNASQKVFTKVIANEGGTSTQTVLLPETVKKGIYNLQLVGQSVKLTKNLVVE